MKQDFAKIIMNPVRQRIVQFLIIHGKGTTNEIKEELSDIPPASLYRHIKVLYEAGCIKVTQEKKVRGTIEKTYELEQHPMGDTVSNEDVAVLVQSSLMSIMVSFQKYFAREDIEPVKDMVSLTTSTLLLSDEEYMDMMQKIGKIYQEVIYNKPNEERKPRRITMISSPCEE